MECLRCKTQTCTPEEEQKLPICSGCRKDFKEFDKLVEFLNTIPKDHPERVYLFGSQLADRQAFISGCDPKKSAIHEKLTFEIKNLYRLRDGLPLLVKEELKVVEAPKLQTEPLIVVEPAITMVMTP